MKPLLALNVVGLSARVLNRGHTPFLKQLVEDSNFSFQKMTPTVPAVTCSAQSTLLTGSLPNEHGIVGNGWLNKELMEIQFWKQSNRLVQKESLWTSLKKTNPTLKTANSFWWYNMYCGADYSVTPRPLYPADGRKIPDCYTHPMTLRDRLTEELGIFPLFKFWGPMTSSESSWWIARASALIQDWHKPEFHCVYIPHLDYGLQKYGPDSVVVEDDLKEVDNIVRWFFKNNAFKDHAIVVLSEYGISNVSESVSVNRVLREHGLLTVKSELGRELLDPGASAAFAVADHQIAHVYVNSKRDTEKIETILESIKGVAKVLSKEEQKEFGLNHERSGDFVCLAEEGFWFDYYYWKDDSKAPDFARTVDIHRKPGYDPVELFLDPQITFPKLKVARTLLNRKLGGKALMDVIGFNTSLVKGSHGITPKSDLDYPVIITPKNLPNSAQLELTGRSSEKSNYVSPLSFHPMVHRFFS